MLLADDAGGDLPPDGAGGPFEDGQEMVPATYDPDTGTITLYLPEDHPSRDGKWVGEGCEAFRYLDDADRPDDESEVSA